MAEKDTKVKESYRGSDQKAIELKESAIRLRRAECAAKGGEYDSKSGTCKK